MDNRYKISKTMCYAASLNAFSVFMNLWWENMLFLLPGMIGKAEIYNERNITFGHKCLIQHLLFLQIEFG